MPDDLPSFFARLRTVAERIEATAAGIPAAHIIREDAAYLVSEIIDYQSPVSDRWKCAGCGKVVLLGKPAKRKAVPRCRVCGGEKFSPERPLGLVDSDS